MTIAPEVPKHEAPAAREAHAAAGRTGTLRVLVSHPCRLTGEVLAQSLGASGDVAALKLIQSSHDLDELAAGWRPHVVVMAGVAGPAQVELARSIATQRRCGVVVVATEPSRASVDATFGQCNVSLLSHHSPLAQLVHAVRGAAVGCPTIDSAFVRSSEDQRVCPLSDREREVLVLTSEGLPLKEIAEQLFLTPGTVRNISSAAIKKLDARNRYDAARVAHTMGWL